MNGNGRAGLAAFQTSVLDPVRRAARWWIDSLVGSLPPRFRRCCSKTKQQAVLTISGDGATLLVGTDTDANNGQSETLVDPAGLTAAAAILLPGSIKDLFVAVEVEADAVLSRNVTWPLETEANLGNALGFQLERLIPLSSDAVYFAHSITRRDKHTNQLHFDLVAVPKALVDPWLDALEASRIGHRLNALWAKPVGRGINLLPPEKRRLETAGSRIGRRLTAVLVVILLVAAVSLPFIAQQRELELQDAALSAAMKKANNVRASADAIETRADLVRTLAAEADKQTYHAAVLAELARLLPDTAYLQRVTVKGNEVRVVGLADNSLALVDALSDSPWFRTVEFVSKVTRDTRSGKDRFQLRMEAAASP